MNKKITAFLTAVSVLAGVCAPVCADSAEELPAEIVITLSDTEDADAGETSGEIEAEDSASEETVSDAEATLSEAVESAADKDEEDADAPAETTDIFCENDTADDEEYFGGEAEDRAEDTDDYYDESDDDGYITDTADNELTTDEAEFHAAAWADWDESTGTLTLKGQLCDTYYNQTEGKNYNIARLSGIDEKNVKRIVITEGTLAGTSTAQMFYGMKNLKEIAGMSNLDTSNVTTMTGMFLECDSLVSIDLSSLDTRNVTKMNGMFAGCNRLTSVYLRNFDTSKVTNMNNMFQSCPKLKKIVVSAKWKTPAVTTSKNMFQNDKALVGGAGTVFDAEHTDISYAHIDGGTSDPGYLTSINTITAPSNSKPTVKTAFGGRTITLESDDPDAEIYYNFGSSDVTKSGRFIKSGETIFLNKPMTGANAAIYFRAYNGKWSAVGKWGVLNVQLDQPMIRQAGEKSENNFKVYTQAKNSYIVYTLDGTDPKIKEGVQKLEVTNGRLVWDTTVTVNVPEGKTIKAIAVRNGLVTSEIMTYANKD